MAAGIINLQKASGGITKISSADGTGVTELVVPESGELIGSVGNQTIGGVKTFSSSPIVPTPTTGTQAVNKDYVDNNGDVSAVTGFSQISGANEIVGIEFTNNIHDIFGDGSCVATYQFDGNANDLSGTYNSTANSVIYEEGKFGQAVRLDNNNSRLSFPSLPVLRNEKTLSFWVKSNRALSANDEFEIGWLGPSATIGSNFGFLYGVGSCQDLGFWGMGSAYDFSNEGDSNKWSSDGYWHHVVVTMDANNYIKWYVDNRIVTMYRQSDSQTATTYKLNPTTSPFHIGLRSGISLTQAHYVLFDQVRIFNRALTEEEVNVLYVESRPTEDTALNINQGTFIYPKGLAPKGYVKISDIFTGIVPTNGVSDGWKYVAKDENNNFSFYDTKPTLGKTTAELYLKNGKLYNSSDDTEITPVSFLSNKVRIASGVAVELAPSGIAKSVTDSIEAGSYSGKNAVVAYATIDMTATPPTILDSYNVASVVRSSNGVGKVTLVNPVDKTNITAICGSNSVAGTVTSTTKSEINFATGATNYPKTTIIAIGGKF